MFEHAILGIDFDGGSSELTAGSQRVLEHARWLVEHGLKSVDLLHSTASDRFLEAGEGGYVVRHEGLPEGGMERMQQVCAGLAEQGLRAEPVLSKEKPWIAVTRRAIEVGADLVLLGKHEPSDGGPRIGNVAAKVLRKCPCPVWVVHPSSAVCPTRVVAATDLGPVGNTAIRCAASVAGWAQADLHVVHAFQVPFEDAHRGDPDLGGLAAEHRSAVERQVADAVEGAQARVHVACTSPVHGILAAQNELEPDLVVLGTVGRGGIPGFLIGNTAEKVLPRIEGSILVVKPDDFVSPIA